MSKFFGSASQKKEAGAVPLHLQVQPYKRQRLSRFQQDALRERNEAIRDRETERERAEIEAELATTELQLIEAGACEISKASPQSSNRKKPGSQVTRTETPAATKLKYIEEMKPAKNSFNHLKDFWKAQVEKYGLQKKSLQNILSKEEHWKELVAQKDLKSKRKKRRARGSEPQELAERLPFKTSPQP